MGRNVNLPFFSIVVRSHMHKSPPIEFCSNKSKKGQLCPTKVLGGFIRDLWNPGFVFELGLSEEDSWPHEHAACLTHDPVEVTRAQLQ